MEFKPVRCPRDGSVVMEIATGLSRGKCPDCRRRIWASSDGKSVRVGMVDAPLAKVAG